IRISGTSPARRQPWSPIQEGAADHAPRIGLLHEETLGQGVRSAGFRRHRTVRPRAIGGEAGAVSEVDANCTCDASGICLRLSYTGSPTNIYVQGEGYEHEKGD